MYSGKGDWRLERSWTVIDVRARETTEKNQYQPKAECCNEIGRYRGGIETITGW